MNRHTDCLVGLLSSDLGLCSLLLVAPNHDHAKEGANNSGTEEDDDDGDANSPNAGREEVLERVIVVDKGHEKSPDSVVGEDDGSGHEHGETDDFVQHC
jgi:hypothetical protein